MTWSQPWAQTSTSTCPPPSQAPCTACTTWPLPSPVCAGCWCSGGLGGLWQSSLCLIACISVEMGCWAGTIAFSLGGEPFHDTTGSVTLLPWMGGRMMLSQPDWGRSQQRRVVTFLPYCESLWHHWKRVSQVHGECQADELGYHVKGALPFSLMASIGCILTNLSEFSCTPEYPWDGNQSGHCHVPQEHQPLWHPQMPLDHLQGISFVGNCMGISFLLILSLSSAHCNLCRDWAALAKHHPPFQGDTDCPAISTGQLLPPLRKRFVPSRDPLAGEGSPRFHVPWSSCSHPPQKDEDAETSDPLSLMSWSP